MSPREKRVPWERRVRYLVLPEESLPVPEWFDGNAHRAANVAADHSPIRSPASALPRPVRPVR